MREFLEGLENQIIESIKELLSINYFEQTKKYCNTIRRFTDQVKLSTAIGELEWIKNVYDSESLSVVHQILSFTQECEQMLIYRGNSDHQKFPLTTNLLNSLNEAILISQKKRKSFPFR